MLYLEPGNESDRHGFEEFIQYLGNRTLAGLALEGPCSVEYLPIELFSNDCLAAWRRQDGAKFLFCFYPNFKITSDAVIFCFFY